VEGQIIDLTAQIVSAHVAANDVLPDQLPALIRDVHEALSTVGQAPAEPVKAEPAVAANRSVFADHILCLDCGGNFKMLKRHLSTDHQTTPEEYRIKWGLPPSYPIVPPEYAAARSRLALANGLGRKVVAEPPPKKRGRPKKGNRISRSEPPAAKAARTAA
jgi:predicted transcriptional regulator